ncbi:MAG: DUF1476 domain-containing protein [Micavibrio aeruginosavorus]|uniref:DUF1476 domain-containing protein n=1 Tax=Micavibrio aeruginosavorus TaxID=349221 RepID=A0A2W5FPP7_9BACT|nr:MAG: DUF1476 domain-containing protein [Micavibrio aeruginosavorus]
MSTIDDRGKFNETQYAHDQQKLFRIEARASKLIGLWAAEKLSLSGETADEYAKEVIASNLDEPGFGDVKRKIMADFQAHHLNISEHMIDVAIEKKLTEAAHQIDNDLK